MPPAKGGVKEKGTRLDLSIRDSVVHTVKRTPLHVAPLGTLAALASVLTSLVYVVREPVYGPPVSGIKGH